MSERRSRTQELFFLTMTKKLSTMEHKIEPRTLSALSLSSFIMNAEIGCEYYPYSHSTFAIPLLFHSSSPTLPLLFPCSRPPKPGMLQVCARYAPDLPGIPRYLCCTPNKQLRSPSAEEPGCWLHLQMVGQARQTRGLTCALRQMKPATLQAWCVVHVHCSTKLLN